MMGSGSARVLCAATLVMNSSAGASLSATSTASAAAAPLRGEISAGQGRKSNERQDMCDAN